MPTLPAEALEDDASREITEGESATLRYDVVRAASELEALGAVQVKAPLSYQGLPRGKIRITPEGGSFYRAEVPYEYSQPETTDPAAGQPPPGVSTGEPPQPAPTEQLPQEMQFSTGISGGLKFLRSRATINKILSLQWQGGGMVAPDYRGYINVQPDGSINGCELPTPDSTFSITNTFPTLTYGWYDAMTKLVWCANLFKFRGLDVNEVVFLGASGSYKGDGWPVTCNFGVSRHKKNIKVDGDNLIVPIKQGWDYLWTAFRWDTSIAFPKIIVPQPWAAYVERILEQSDFGVLGLDL